MPLLAPHRPISPRVTLGPSSGTHMANDELIVLEDGDFRSLHFGSDWVQGRMRVSDPAQLVLEYTQEMCAALLLVPRPRHVWVGGLGVGALPRFALAHWQETLATLHICETRADVIALAATLFPLPRSIRRGRPIRIEQADAVTSLSHAVASAYDWLWVDCYDHAGRVGRTESEAFFRSAHRALAAGGVLVSNLWSNVPRYPKTLAALRRVFDGNVLLLPSLATENVVAIASKQPLSDLASRTMAARARALGARYGLPFEAWRKRMVPADGGTEESRRAGG